MQALMDYELVGFQTMRDRKNFARCLQTLIPEARISGRGGVVTASVGERSIRLGAIPISIDFTLFFRYREDAESRRYAAFIEARF